MVVDGGLGILTRWLLRVNRNASIQQLPGRLQISEWSPEPYFVRKTARATMNTARVQKFRILRGNPAIM